MRGKRGTMEDVYKDYKILKPGNPGNYVGWRVYKYQSLMFDFLIHHSSKFINCTTKILE